MGDTSLLLELRDDGRLVGIAESGRAEDGGELGVLGEDLAEVGQGAGRGVDAGGLDGGRVLNHSCRLDGDALGDADAPTTWAKLRCMHAMPSGRPHGQHARLYRKAQLAHGMA